MPTLILQPTPPIVRQGLVRKYRELLALRQEHEDFVAAGVSRLHGQPAQSRRHRKRALAAAFPGALRELEGRTVAAIDGLLGELQAPPITCDDFSVWPVWPRLAWVWHALVAAHLRGKRDNRPYAPVIAGLSPLWPATAQANETELEAGRLIEELSRGWRATTVQAFLGRQFAMPEAQICTSLFGATE